MNFLLLVKHSLPEIIPDRPAREWQLSAAGRQRCAGLASRLAPYNPGILVSSLEPKAAQTAEISASLLGRPVTSAPNLHEHERQRVGWADKASFEANIANFFKHPDELVMGEETASQAHLRFKQAVEGLMERYPAQTLAVVAHGTVISLFAARIANLDPFPLWQQLGLPSVVVLSRPDLRLVKIIAQT